MKQTSHVLWREIRRQPGRFFSIVSIVTLGVGFLSGLLSTAPSMRKSMDAYYDECRMMDVRVLSTLGLTEENIGELRETDGVVAVMPAYFQDTLLTWDGYTAVTRLDSLPDDRSEDNDDYLNRVTVIEGRLPEKAGEIVLEQRSMSGRLLPAVGDTLTLAAENGDLSETLASTTYTVVGLVTGPLYYSLENESTTVGSGSVEWYAYTAKEEFLSEVYSEAYIQIEGAAEQASFSSDYDQTVAPVIDRLTAVGEAISATRYEEVRSKAQQTLDDAQDEIDSGRRELADAQQELADAQAEWESGYQEWQDGQQAYETQKAELEEKEQEWKSSQAELEGQQQEFTDKQAELTVAGTSLSSAEAALAEQKQQLDAVQAALDTLAEQIAALQAAGQLETAAALQAEWEAQSQPLTAGQAAYAAAQETYQQQKAAYEAAAAQWEASAPAAQEQLTAAQKQLDDAQKQLEDGWQQLESAAQELAEAKAELDNSNQELQEAQNEYDQQAPETEQKLADAQAEVDSGREELEQIAYPTWYVLDRDSHTASSSFGGNTDKIDSIAAVFPLFFFLVAALVVLTTMTRMVEEQRTQMGTMKALGYSVASISRQYLGYALLGGVAGCVAGILIGMQLFPQVIWQTYSILYVLPSLRLSWDPVLLLSTSLAMLAVILLTTYAACRHALKEQAAQLMRPKAPPAGKRVFLEHITFIWKRMNFIHKVTARNLLRYFKRFCMTVIGVAGCTALLVTGFGLNDSIDAVVDRQFSEIWTFDLLVSVNDTDDVDVAALLASDEVEDSLYTSLETVTSPVGKTDQEYTLRVPQDPDRLAAFITLRERRSGTALTLTDDGVIVTEKLATKLGVDVGDPVTIVLADQTAATLTVNGITENYAYDYLYLTPTAYRQAFEREADMTSLLINLPESTEEDDLRTRLLACDGVDGLRSSKEICQSFDRSMNSINYVVLVLILAAAALAFVVLYNLTNINITERQRELATLKVLGFLPHEVDMYIFRETGILSLIGSLVGLVAGKFLHAFVVKTAEVDIVMFGRTISPFSYLASIALTMLFTVIVALVMHRKLTAINMVESLKSAE